MKIKWHLFLAFTLCILTSSEGIAEDIYSVQHVTLYNQMDVFSYRSPSAEILATFKYPTKIILTKVT
jgi:hypothetical protein